MSKISDYRQELDNQIKQNRKREEIIRNFYILRPTCSFENHYHYAEKIILEVSNHFNVPLSNILVCGSAKLGFSLAKNSDFKPGESDLDLAIVDASIFTKYFNIILKETNNYNKKHLFLSSNDQDNKALYLSFLNRGIINPIYMPNIREKTEILSFFSRLSIPYRNHFASISVCFYLSEYSFQRKQQSALHTWITNYNPNLIGEII